MTKPKIKGFATRNDKKGKVETEGSVWHFFSKVLPIISALLVLLGVLWRLNG